MELELTNPKNARGKESLRRRTGSDWRLTKGFLHACQAFLIYMGLVLDVDRMGRLGKGLWAVVTGVGVS